MSVLYGYPALVDCGEEVTSSADCFLCNDKKCIQEKAHNFHNFNYLFILFGQYEVVFLYVVTEIDLAVDQRATTVKFKTKV